MKNLHFHGQPERSMHNRSHMFLWGQQTHRKHWWTELQRNNLFRAEQRSAEASILGGGCLVWVWAVGKVGQPWTETLQGGRKANWTLDNNVCQRNGLAERAPNEKRNLSALQFYCLTHTSFLHCSKKVALEKLLKSRGKLHNLMDFCVACVPESYQG